MSDRKLAFLYSPEIDALHYPADCPFKSERAGYTRQRLRSFGLLDGANRFEIAPQKASVADLGKFHSTQYLEQLQRAAGGDLTVQGLRMGLGGPDTPVFKDMFEYGAWACGASLTAADVLLAREADVAFNLLGGFHHAMADKAGGFCYLNDVVLACLKLTGAGKRVLYLDLDAHHGDGVQAAFYRRADVLTISLHESGKTLYPWSGFEDETGEGPGAGFNVNVPLPAETYDEAFLTAFERVVVPMVEAYFPGVIVLELGMDILAGDPLTHLRMTNNVVVDIIERLVQYQHPMLVAGGGGYHVENTVRGWALAWRTLCGESDGYDSGFGLGGVMLESSEWAGGLQDRSLPVTLQQRRAVEPALQTTIENITNSIFRIHGIRACSSWRANAPAQFCGSIIKPN
jgi:acetoin utilization protein AcuC